MANLIQNNILKPLFIKRFNGHRSGASFVPLKEAENIGIVADMMDPANPSPIIKFSKELYKLGHKPSLILLVPEKQKEVNPFDYEKHFPGMPVDLVCKDDFGFLGTPKAKVMDHFINQRFDILIRLAAPENFALDCIVWKSQARMYVGSAGSAGQVLDFVLDVAQSPDISYLIDNLLIYLPVLQNKPDAQRIEPKSKLF